MISIDSIEDLGWALTPAGEFMFESEYESIMYWVLELKGDKVQISSMSDTSHLITEFKGEVSDPMELYDIMMSLNIIPSDE